VRRRVREKPGENIGNGAGFRFRVFVLKSIDLFISNLQFWF
jgi:hypothetical protein